MRIKILVLATTVLTFMLINLGGYVHNTGSSLACPDWPLCHGQVMPVMEGGVLIEHTHRLLASLVGFLTLIIAILARKTNAAKTARLALAMVVVQGILGGITVIYKLPAAISTAHLGLSIIYFCTLIYLHQKLFLTGKRLIAEPMITLACVFIYFQILLGALIRHLGLGVACGVGAENSIQCFDVVSMSRAWLPVSGEALLHMSHRYFGVFCGIWVAGMTIMYFKKKKSPLYFVPVLLVGIQIWLGVLTVSTAMRPYITMLHLSGATLLIGVIWKIRINSKRPRSSGMTPFFK